MLIQAIIIEDEAHAVEKLERLLSNMDDRIDVLEVLSTKEEAVNWLKQHSCDLIFMDIYLADGNSFEIFDEVPVQTPIIFITAYDEFAIKAFEQNSIDYLLKPFGEEELIRAIKKYKSLYHTPNSPNPIMDFQKLNQLLNNYSHPKSKNFLLQIGSKLKKIELKEVAYFYSHEKNTFLTVHEGRQYPIDETLSQIESQIAPSQFFRLNRKFLINRKAIKNVFYLASARIKLELQPKTNFETTVPIEKIGKFKTWLKD